MGNPNQGLFLDGELGVDTIHEPVIDRIRHRNSLRTEFGGTGKTCPDNPTFRGAPLTHEVAMVSRLVETPHLAPVDRLLAATAAVYDLTLLSADEQILRGKGFSITDDSSTVCRELLATAVVIGEDESLD